MWEQLALKKSPQQDQESNTRPHNQQLGLQNHETLPEFKDKPYNPVVILQRTIKTFNM